MKTLTKNIFRTFRRTWARFLSVSLLIGLAIFLFLFLLDSSQLGLICGKPSLGNLKKKI